MLDDYEFNTHSKRIKHMIHCVPPCPVRLSIQMTSIVHIKKKSLAIPKLSEADNKIHKIKTSKLLTF